MTHIMMRRDIRQREMEISVSGHAGYANPGQDIVCAAISGLVLALHAWLIRHEELTRLANRQDGEAVFRFSACPESCAVYEMFWCGAASIAAEYPQFVSLEVLDLKK